MSLSSRSSALCVPSCVEQGENLFLTWLPFCFLNPFSTYLQQFMPLEAVHIIPLSLLPKVPSGSVNLGYVSFTFVTCSGCLWKESKATFLISHLPMDLYHSITLWSSYMSSFSSRSPQSCSCALPSTCLLRFSPLSNWILTLVLSPLSKQLISKWLFSVFFWFWNLEKLCLCDFFSIRCDLCSDIICNFFCRGVFWVYSKPNFKGQLLFKKPPTVVYILTTVLTNVTWLWNKIWWTSTHGRPHSGQINENKHHKTRTGGRFRHCVDLWGKRGKAQKETD